MIYLTHSVGVTHISVSKLAAIICSDNGLAPGRQWWTNVNSNLGNKLQWNLQRNSYISIQKNAFESVCTVAAILFQCQCVNEFYISQFLTKWSQEVIISHHENELLPRVSFMSSNLTLHILSLSRWLQFRIISRVFGVTSLPPPREIYDNNFNSEISQQMLHITSMHITCKIAFSWRPQNGFDDNSTLVQVIALCRGATSHRLSQC